MRDLASMSDSPSEQLGSIRLKVICNREIIPGKKCNEPLLRGIHVNGTAVIECPPCPKCKTVTVVRWDADGVKVTLK